MKKYVALTVVKIDPGTELVLTEQQANARNHSVVKEGKHYKTVGQVQFKAGEEVTFVKAIPKVLADKLSPVASNAVTKKTARRKSE